MRNKLKDINLKNSNNIAFPDICVFCGKVNPDSTVPLSPPYDNNGNGEHMPVFAVPACKSCLFAFNDNQRQISIFAFTLFLIIFTGIVAFVLHSNMFLFYVALSAFVITAFSSLDALKGTKKAIAIRKANSSAITFRILKDEYFNEFLVLNDEFLLEKGKESN